MSKHYKKVHLKISGFPGQQWGLDPSGEGNPPEYTQQLERESMQAAVNLGGVAKLVVERDLHAAVTICEVTQDYCGAVLVYGSPAEVAEGVERVLYPHRSDKALRAQNFDPHAYLEKVSRVILYL